MSQMLQDLTKANKNGGNMAVIVQMKVDTDGKYIAATAADVFGEAAGTAHFLGSFQDSDMKRQTDGSRVLNCTVMEQDLLRHNLLELVAPASGAAATSDLIEMEDGIASVGSASGSGFDSNKPVFALFYFLAPLGGKARLRHGFVQFKPEGGHDGQKSKQWNVHKWSLYTIDANGSIAVTKPSDDAFTDFTIPALDAPYQFSKVIEAA